jgi:ribosome-associated protein
MANKKKSGAKKPTRKTSPAGKAQARKAFRPGAAGGRKPVAGAARKLPRKSGPRRKMPRSIGREAAPQARAPVPGQPDPSRETALQVARAGLDKKAEGVTVFDVRGLSSYADYLVIMTADSDRQSGAIADHVDQQLKAAGHAKIAVEGYEAGNWIIVDYGDVVTHVMGRETRAFYDLEGLWADAPRVEVKG